MDEESQIEQLISAHRERSALGELRFASVFHDLTAEARETAFELSLLQRALEAEQDADGLSTTARAVLARIERA